MSSSRPGPLGASFAFLGGMILSMVAAQLTFKLAGNYAAERLGLIGSFAVNPWLWVGLLLSANGMICWLMTLRLMPLASAYPWTALIYVLTPMASALLFSEVLSGKYLVGLVFIVGGVFITAGEVDSP